MPALNPSWTKLVTNQQLQRSSHNVSVIDSTVYIFGGELKPREPRDNDVHKIGLGQGKASVQSIKAIKSAPLARVGAATTTIGNRMFMFSGRGGAAMAPVDEQGAMWMLDTTANNWELLEPSSSTFPEARSYHCMASDDKDTIWIHAGCPESGRLADLWSFTISSRQWKQLAGAPGPQRGGTSIAFAQGKLYRMNGFDGKTEQGGSLDVYDPRSDEWSTISYPADGTSGPGARSVAALLPVKLDDGTFLVTLFGESDPSSLGHQGAGKMLSDVWAYSLDEGKWSQLTPQAEDTPDARGWFDADVLSFNGKESIAVAGGLGESNERLSDLWVLSF